MTPAEQDKWLCRVVLWFAQENGISKKEAVVRIVKKLKKVMG